MDDTHRSSYCIGNYRKEVVEVMDIERGKYILRSDAACCWVDEVIAKTDKKTRKTTVYTKNVSGYYPNFKQLAEWGLAPHVLRSSEATSVKKLLEQVKDIEKKISDMTYSRIEKIAK